MLTCSFTNTLNVANIIAFARYYKNLKRFAYESELCTNEGGGEFWIVKTEFLTKFAKTEKG